MNAKVKALVFVVSVVALVSGLIVVVYVLSPPIFFHTNPYDMTMKIQSCMWGTNNAYIMLSVKNTATRTMSVNEVRINNTVVKAVAYGGNFTGTTTQTLDPQEMGTITITYPFLHGIEYVFQIGETAGWLSVPYGVAAP